MTKNQRYALLGGALGAMTALGLVLLLAVVLVGSGGENAQVVDSTPDITQGGTHEGINVHGDWVVEVQDPSGRVVARREFDNELLRSGVLALADILVGRKVIKEWTLVIAGSRQQAPCRKSNGSAASCRLTQTTAGDGNVSPNLTLRLTESRIVFSGIVNAQNDGDLAAVSTEIYLCSVMNPSDCTTTGFSSKSLPSALPVVAGQTIVVTYTLRIS